MKYIKKFNQINEGTWSLSKEPKDYDNFISEIEELKNKYYNIIGNDSIFDGLDSTIAEIKKLKENAPEIKIDPSKIIKSTPIYRKDDSLMDWDSEVLDKLAKKLRSIHKFPGSEDFIRDRAKALMNIHKTWIDNVKPKMSTDKVSETLYKYEEEIVKSLENESYYYKTIL